ncbi:hypothetical protein DL98DRAFT_522147 [Cadophora sp. DSE1049]|nr:hypothetical protein DL98DRAFT_522147 [Cadophora sp. DSE1049]
MSLLCAHRPRPARSSTLQTERGSIPRPATKSNQKPSKSNLPFPRLILGMAIHPIISALFIGPVSIHVHHKLSCQVKHSIPNPTIRLIPRHRA